MEKPKLKIKKKKKNILPIIYTITDNEELKKLNNYIEKILNEHATDVIKTYDCNFGNIKFKNAIMIEIKDYNNLNKINIKGRNNEPFFGMLKDLKNITLNITINNKNFTYYKE